MAVIDIEYKEITFSVEFDYQPEEKAVMYYSDGSGYPGCPASVDILNIYHCEDSFYDWFTEKDLELLEDLIFEKIYEN